MGRAGAGGWGGRDQGWLGCVCVVCVCVCGACACACACVRVERARGVGAWVCVFRCVVVWWRGVCYMGVA